MSNCLSEHELASFETRWPDPEQVDPSLGGGFGPGGVGYGGFGGGVSGGFMGLDFGGMGVDHYLDLFLCEQRFSSALAFREWTTWKR